MAFIPKNNTTSIFDQSIFDAQILDNTLLLTRFEDDTIGSALRYLNNIDAELSSNINCMISDINIIIMKSNRAKEEFCTKFLYTWNILKEACIKAIDSSTNMIATINGNNYGYHNRVEWYNQNKIEKEVIDMFISRLLMNGWNPTIKDITSIDNNGIYVIGLEITCDFTGKSNNLTL